MPDTRPGLDALRALSEAATPGRWYVDGPEFGGMWVCVGHGADQKSAAVHPSSKDQPYAVLAGMGEADSDFIVAAVNYVRDLLASPATGDSRPCARYFGSDGTLCATHNGRFLSDTTMRCERAGYDPHVGELASIADLMPATGDSRPDLDALRELRAMREALRKVPTDYSSRDAVSRASVAAILGRRIDELALASPATGDSRPECGECYFHPGTCEEHSYSHSPMDPDHPNPCPECGPVGDSRPLSTAELDYLPRMRLAAERGVATPADILALLGIIDRLDRALRHGDSRQSEGLDADGLALLIVSDLFCKPEELPHGGTIPEVLARVAALIRRAEPLLAAAAPKEEPR